MAFLRLARTIRPTATTKSGRPIASHFFNSTPSSLRPRPVPSPSPQMGLRARLFSSQNRGRNYYSANKNLIRAIIGLNVSIFGYSAYSNLQYNQGHRAPYIKFVQNFTLNLNRFKDEGRYWTALTSVFNHGNLWHLGGNLISFYYMSQLLARTPGIGPAHLLTLVLGSGLTGSAFWLYQRLDKSKGTRGPDPKVGLGFSGAVMGVGAAAACMYPRVTFQIYGIIPVPLGLLVAGYAIFDGYYMNDPKSRVAHEGHLGGMAFGLLYYLLKIRRFHMSGL